MEKEISHRLYMKAFNIVTEYHKMLYAKHAEITGKRINQDPLEFYIEQMDFSLRVKNVCREMGLMQLKDLAALGRNGLKNTRNLGAKSRKEIINMCFDLGVNLV